MPLVALAFGTGVGGYFAAPAEPSATALAGLAGISALALMFGWLRRADFGGIGVFLGALILGVLVASLRTHTVAAPVLGFRYYGPIEGRVVKVDLSASSRPRVILDQVRLGSLDPARTPTRVRVSFQPDSLHFTLMPGQRLGLTGHLSPPQGPTEPGGFDFQRHAWFLGIGAFGYSRAPPVQIAAPDTGYWLARLRHKLGAGLAARMPETTAGVAVALSTGDRSGLDPEVLDNLRAANLAHLLAISGLHMGLLSGFVFASARLALSLHGRSAQRWPTKKLAVIIALLAATAYLLISGLSVATQRAFIMVTVAMVAILADRRAVTLRAVAMAALIILLIRPEALVGPGFQMSFAATIGLVIAFRSIRDAPVKPLRGRFVKGVAAVVISSFVAGMATAPFSAAHFNMVGQYGLLANVLSVPLMGILVMPLLVVAALLAPFGLEALPLWGVHMGLTWILGVADFVAGLDGSRRLFKAPDPWVIPLFAGGVIWCIAWQGRARLGGLVAALAALLLWVQTERPLMLIAEDGGLMGVWTPEGRALSRPRGAGFVAQSWLARDGQGLDQETAAALPQTWEQVDLFERTWVTLRGRNRAARLAAACEETRSIVITHQEDAPEGHCTTLSPRFLRATGSLAVMADGQIRTARAYQGARPWVPRPIVSDLDLLALDTRQAQRN